MTESIEIKELKENMTICQCCEFIANMTDDESILEAVDYIETKAKRMYEKIQLLKSENKALDKEGLAKCELNEKLEKALDKASETLAKSKFKMTCGEAIKTCMENHCFGYSCVHSRNFTKEEWKAWALNEKA